MKLLGWMHRKQRQTENAAELTIGMTQHRLFGFGSSAVQRFITGSLSVYSCTQLCFTDLKFSSYNSNNSCYAASISFKDNKMVQRLSLRAKDVFFFVFTGYPFLEDQQNHMKHAYGSKSVRQTYRDYDLRRSFGGLEAATIEENYDEDSSAAAISEIFHGFLAIGTLGSDTASYPSTPAFTTSFESITEKENEVTETELKLISDELERVLAAEAMEDDCNFSSGRNSLVSNGRNSHVSNGRSSHGSTITLSGRQLESADTTGNGNTICPLQGYLFGSALEVQPTTMPKKEQRTSLGELFQRSKAAEDYYKQKSDKSGKREAEKSAIQLMKKILKKTKLHTSPKNTNTSAGATDDITFTETKLTKILQMFQRKVHPESTTTAQNPKNLKRFEIKNLPRSEGEHMLADKNMTITAHTTPKSSIQSLNGQSNPTKLGYLNENGECWIKTDADYLVLEL